MNQDANKATVAMSEDPNKTQLDQMHARQNSQSEAITRLVQISTESTSNIGTLTEAMKSSIKHNEREHDRTREEIKAVRDAKNKSFWPAVGIVATLILSTVGVAVVMAVLVLGPINNAIMDGQNEFRSNHTETRLLVKDLQDADADARVERAIITERHRQEIRIARAWAGTDGRPAFPNPTD